MSTRSWGVRNALAAREPFNTHGAFRAVTGPPPTLGRLPDHWQDLILGAHRNRITYTVMSYRTPIAWVVDDGTIVIPDVRYSITTTGHQGLLYALYEPRNSFPPDCLTPAWLPTRPPESASWPRVGRPVEQAIEPQESASSRTAPGESLPVLERIRQACEEADRLAPEPLRFEGPPSLADIPNLAYIDAAPSRCDA